MLLSGILFALFLASGWFYCLTDASLLPAQAFPGWPKPAWVAIIATTFIIGAIAWILARRRWRARHWPFVAYDYPPLGGAMYPDHRPAYPDHPPADAADAALARHPAGRSRAARPGGTGRNAPRGPDDDAEFLQQLDHRIRGELRQCRPA